MTTIIILVIATILVFALALHVARQPDVFRVTRSAKINAAPETVFPWLDNPRKAAEWSPWVQMEPDADYQYAGPDAGVGAMTTWNGKKSGAGKLTVTDVTPNERVVMRLEFTRPMKCVNTVEYTLTPANDGTTVTWTMFGPNNLRGKMMSVVMDCEKMCGDQFETGLRNLDKTVGGTR